MGNSSQVDVLADAIGGALHRDEFASQWVADIRALGAEGERLRMLVEGLHRENDALRAMLEARGVTPAAITVALAHTE
jgi:hypothetical protein